MLQFKLSHLVCGRTADCKVRQQAEVASLNGEQIAVNVKSCCALPKELVYLGLGRPVVNGPVPWMRIVAAPGTLSGNQMQPMVPAVAELRLITCRFGQVC
jgi:hypothetical protein